MNNKGRRQELTKLKYVKRLKRYTAGTKTWYFEDGRKIDFPTIADLIAEKALLIFKTSSVACSCWMCSGADKYNRNEFRKETKRLLDEYFNGDCGELG